MIVIEAMRFKSEHPGTPGISAILGKRPFPPEKRDWQRCVNNPIGIPTSTREIGCSSGLRRGLNRDWKGCHAVFKIKTPEK